MRPPLPTLIVEGRGPTTNAAFAEVHEKAKRYTDGDDKWQVVGENYAIETVTALDVRLVCKLTMRRIDWAFAEAAA